MKNRYSGTCACGLYVEAGQGVAVKLGGRWTVRCAACGDVGHANPAATDAAPAAPASSMPNRWPGSCTCGRAVAANAGLAVKLTGGWSVRCALCAEELIKMGAVAAPRSATSATSTARTIAADGTIAIPYSSDEGQVALLRSLTPPKGRPSAWDADAKCWRANVAPGDLRRTLDVARRLHLDIAAELLERERTEVTVEASAAASIPGLLHFQIAGVEFLASGENNRLLADDQGCIDGEAVVRLNRAGRGFALKLADLYHRFNGGAARGGKYWDPAIPTYIRSLCDGELRLNLVSKVLDKGVRPVVKLTLTSGKTLRLTPDHEVLSGSEWVRTDTLKTGDTVMTNGAAACKLCGSTERVSTYPYAKFVGVCRTCMYRKLREKPTYKDGRRPDKTGYILVSGQWDHPRHDPNGTVREHVLVMEKKLGRYLEPGERVHHIDENPANNAPENLQLVSDSSHASIHGRTGGYRKMNGGVGGKGGLVQFVPVVDTVASVEPDGEAHVYDVVCANPHRNFVANGIVVHNCGKTIEVLCALPRSGELPPVLVIVPACIKFNWKAEAETWAPMYTSVVLEGKNSFRWPKPAEIVIVNYDVLPEAAERPGTGGAKTRKKDNADDHKRRKDTHLKFVAKAPAKVITVIDEAHNCRNNTNRTRRVRGIVSASHRAWGLTGTPLLNHPDQLWRVFQAIDVATLCFGSWNNFCRLFHATRNRWGGYEWGMPMPEVPERLRRAMLRRTKAEVLPDLPKKRYQVMAINGVGAALRAEMDRLWEEWGDVIENEGQLPPFEEFSKIREALAASRTPAVLEWVEPYEDAGCPLVVFSAHRAPVDALGKREGWETITGDTTSERRADIVKRFQDGGLRGVACTIAAAGVGLTLTRASTALFVDLDWTPALNIQAQDRLHRIGQTAAGVLYVRMVSTHPLDAHIQGLIAKKMEMIEASIERLVKVPAPEIAAEQSRGEREATARELEAIRAAEVVRLSQEAAAIREAERTEARERCVAITARQREKLGAEAPELPLTSERVAAINAALSAMLSVCDGAHVKDGVGFNKPDAVRSRWLSVLGLEDEDAQRCALSMLQGYRRQLGERFPILWK